jgi:hypothetical protein
MKIFASCASDKGLITRIDKEPQKINFQKINDPMKKWANELNRAFSKEVQMAKKHDKMLNISGHKGNALKTTLRYPPHSC